MISEKNIVAYTFLHHSDACMCQKSQQTRHPEKIGYWNFQLLEHIYTYRKKEFRNILVRKLCNWFEQLYLFNVEHGTEHYIDSAYGVCMH